MLEENTELSAYLMFCPSCKNEGGTASNTVHSSHDLQSSAHIDPRMGGYSSPEDARTKTPKAKTIFINICFVQVLSFISSLMKGNNIYFENIFRYSITRT
jgi:hypothetical protein